MKDAIIKGISAKDSTPAVTVNSLYGMGENPATNTTHTPHSANQALAVSNFGKYAEVCNQGSIYSNANAPMKYPRIPPNTEVMVVKNANHHARFGLATDIGANITSGGIGKKEDSAKLNAPK